MVQYGTDQLSLRDNRGAIKYKNSLKRPSHQIISAWKRYGQTGLGGDIRRWIFKILLRLSLILNRPLKFLCDPD
jgi:hypothetical protein